MPTGTKVGMYHAPQSMPLMPTAEVSGRRTTQCAMSMEAHEHCWEYTCIPPLKPTGVHTQVSCAPLWSNKSSHGSPWDAHVARSSLEESPSSQNWSCSGGVMQQCTRWRRLNKQGIFPRAAAFIAVCGNEHQVCRPLGTIQKLKGHFSDLTMIPWGRPPADTSIAYTQNDIAHAGEPGAPYKGEVDRPEGPYKDLRQK